MKLTAAITLFMASAVTANPFRPSSSNSPKSAYVSKLVKGAKVTRSLEQEIDLTAYSLKFEQCQFVKTYSDENAEDEDAATVLATQRFVIFRLCPESSCSSCDYNYGEYVIDLDTYLQATVQYQQELQENMCNACGENCAVEEEEEAEEEEEHKRKVEMMPLKKKRKNKTRMSDVSLPSVSLPMLTVTLVTRSAKRSRTWRRMDTLMPPTSLSAK